MRRAATTLNFPAVVASIRGPADERVAPQGYHAAVAILLSPSASGATSLTLLKRAQRLSDPWSGQVGLPGGRHEPGDPSLLHTARRETLEEIGVDLEGIPCLRSLPAISARGRGTSLDLLIHPFLFALPAPSGYRVQAAEVEEVRTFPLGLLFDPDHGEVLERTTEEGTRKLPAIRLAPDWLLWGLTYRMLHQFASLLDRDLAAGSPDPQIRP